MPQQGVDPLQIDQAAIARRHEMATATARSISRMLIQASRPASSSSGRGESVICQGVSSAVHLPPPAPPACRACNPTAKAAASRSRFFTVSRLSESVAAPSPVAKLITKPPVERRLGNVLAVAATHRRKASSFSSSVSPGRRCTSLIRTSSCSSAAASQSRGPLACFRRQASTNFAAIPRSQGPNGRLESKRSISRHAVSIVS